MMGTPLWICKGVILLLVILIDEPFRRVEKEGLHKVVTIDEVVW